MKIAFSLILAFSSFILLGASCTFRSQQGNGAVFMTSDFGTTWTSKSTLSVTTKRTALLASIDVTAMVFDPRTPDTIFMGTRAHGLFGSNNRGNSWIQILPGQYITGIALDPTSRCTVYLSTPDRLIRTTNCGSSWQAMLSESRKDTGLTSVTVDPRSSSTVYTTTSQGDIFRSLDGGSTWSVVFRFPERSIKRLLIDRRNSSILAFATKDSSVYRSVDRGKTWKDISGSLKDIADTRREYRHFQALENFSSFLLATSDGLYRTRDAGRKWERIGLLTPPQSAKIFAASAASGNDQHIVYATDKAFYMTTNGGVRWTARSSPSILRPSVILMHPSSSGTMYMGMKKIVEDSEYWYRQELDY